MAEERVQKILARAGYGSRRASEVLITAGRVRINGVMAELGSKADPQRDTITVDNQPIAREQASRYIALNKPRGVLSEVSPEEERETVRDLVAVPGHLFIVGRLDMESEGLILLTNDGELANRLTHPRYGHEKEYRVLVGTRPDEEQLQNWRRGIVLEDGHRTAPAEVRLEGISGKNAWLRVILHEGRKRQIREMGRLTGLPVLRIIRIRIGSLVLGEMKPGEWRELRPDELRALRAPAVRQPQARVTRRPSLGGGRQPAEKRALSEGRSGREERAGREIGRPARSPRDGFKPSGGPSPRGGTSQRPGRTGVEGQSGLAYPRRGSATARTDFDDNLESGSRPSSGARPRPARPSTGRRPAAGGLEEGQRSNLKSDREKPSRPPATRRPSASRGAGDDRSSAGERSRPARRPDRPSSGQRSGGGPRAPRGTRRVNRNRSS